MQQSTVLIILFFQNKSCKFYLKCIYNFYRYKKIKGIKCYNEIIIGF
jgi:hypothetical protein